MSWKSPTNTLAKAWVGKAADDSDAKDQLSVYGNSVLGTVNTSERWRGLGQQAGKGAGVAATTAAATSVGAASASAAVAAVAVAAAAVAAAVARCCRCPDSRPVVTWPMQTRRRRT